MTRISRGAEQATRQVSPERFISDGEKTIDLEHVIAIEDGGFEATTKRSACLIFMINWPSRSLWVPYEYAVEKWRAWKERK